MKKYVKRILAGGVLLCLLTGCGGQQAAREPETPFPVSTTEADQIFTETFCVNEAYVELEEEKVYQTISVYQLEDHLIVVNAESNSAFFDGLQYTVQAEGEITSADVQVEWQTMMGSTEDTEEDQKCVADVKLYESGALLSERRINYFAKAIDIVVDTIGQTG